MSTETRTASLPSVDALAARIFLATSATSQSLAYESLPEDARCGYRRIVRETQAAELLRMARDEQSYRAALVDRERRTVAGSEAAAHVARQVAECDRSIHRLISRADELNFIGGDA